MTQPRENSIKGLCQQWTSFVNDFSTQYNRNDYEM